MAPKSFKATSVAKHCINCTLLFVLMMIVSAAAQEPAFVTDFLKVHSFSFDKVSGLAEAIPAEKYEWRPAEGVRSVKECVAHLAGGNYFFASLLGTPVPEGIDALKLDKTVETKEKAISALKESKAHLEQVIHNLSGSVFDQEVDFFGNKVTKRQLIFIAGDHVAEHLGQLIAYARMNGITPPWSK